jgi:hypothetical protein
MEEKSDIRAKTLPTPINNVVNFLIIYVKRLLKLGQKLVLTQIHK